MTYPLSVSGLSTREQITDTIIRAGLGLDSNNKALWESAWAAHQNISLDIDGNILKGLEQLNSGCFDTIGAMDTQHLVSNIRVDVKEGADIAHVTANVLAQHYRAGEGQVLGADRMLAGATYDVMVVKEESGEWKVMTWALRTIWKEGNPAVMLPAEAK
jgi:hypothetical protein